MPDAQDIQTATLRRCAVCGEPGTAHDSHTHQLGTSWRLMDVFWGIVKVFTNLKLLPWALAPVFLSIGLLVVALYYGLTPFYLWSQEQLAQSLQSGWTLEFISILFSATAVIGSGLLFAFLLMPVLGLVSIPFLDPIAARIEQKLITSPYQTPVSLGTIFKEMGALLVFKLLFLIPALALFWVPLLGPLIITFAMALILSLDFLDVIWMRKGYRFQEKREFLAKNKGAWLLFILPIMLMIWIPLLQIIMLPGATAGAVRFYLNARK